MFKTETHLHVSEVSPCGKLTAAEMVKRYHDAGYKTVIISDHFQKQYFDPLGDLPWEEKVDKFLEGYRNAKAAAEEFSMNTIMSAEIRFPDTHNHYLLYGIDEQFLKACPDVLDMTIETFYPYAKAHGITVVQAHPYRDDIGFPTPDFVDAFEIHNSNPRHENYTERSIQTALAHNKPMTAGSDAHRIEDVALSGVVTDEEIRTAQDYVQALMSGQLRLLKGDTEL